MATEKVLGLGTNGIVEKEITVAADDLAIKQSITLTLGQTSVAIPGGYEVTGLIVFLNGVYLSPSEYTATDGVNVVLVTGAPTAGSVLDVISFLSSGILALGTAALRDSIGISPLYGRDSIIGTVSQVAGVPTGAILESGSNANGSFLKFADGTLICETVVRASGNINNAAGAIFSTATLGPFTPPATFVGAFSGFVSSTSESVWFGVLTTSNVIYVRGFSATSLAFSYNYTVRCFGRWY